MAKSKAEVNRIKRFKFAKKEKSKKRINKKRQKLSVILIIIILFTISIAEFAYFFYNISYVKVYNVLLRVDDRIGITVDVESSSLNLGIVPPGGSVERNIVIFNNGTKPLAGNVITKGNLAQFLSIEKNFAIQKDEAKSLSVIANVPRDTETGNYTGKIILIFKRL